MTSLPDLSMINKGSRERTVGRKVGREGEQASKLNQMFISLSKQIDLFLHNLRLKRRRQLKQSQSGKSVAEQNRADSSAKMPVISCPDPAFSEPLERIKPNLPGGSGKTLS